MKLILITILLASLNYFSVFKSELEMSSATFKHIEAKFILENAMSPKQNPSRRTPFVLIYQFTDGMGAREAFMARFDPREIGDLIDLHIWSGLCQFRQQDHDFISIVPRTGAGTQFNAFVNNLGLGGNISNNYGLAVIPERSDNYRPLWRYAIVLNRIRLYTALIAAVNFNANLNLLSNWRFTDGAYGQAQRLGDYEALRALRTFAQLEVDNPTPVRPNPNAPPDPINLPAP